jgi:biotin transport system substrate-specific component
VFFALCTGWAGAARIYLPFTPVPITLQTLTVLLAGGVMGYRLGITSMLVYLALGCAGMPFFADMKSGTAVMCGPTAGYLIGFVAAAWIVGRMTHVPKPSWKRLAAGFAAGSAVIYVCGVAGLLLAVPGIGFGTAVMRGVAPFLAGDVLKAAAGVGVLGAAGERTRRVFPPGE